MRARRGYERQVMTMTVPAGRTQGGRRLNKQAEPVPLQHAKKQPWTETKKSGSRDGSRKEVVKHFNKWNVSDYEF